MISMSAILQQAKALKPSERKELLRLLKRIVAVDDSEMPPPSLRDLRGLVKDIARAAIVALGERRTKP